jgi:hypothetical protein
MIPAPPTRLLYPQTIADCERLSYPKIRQRPPAANIAQVSRLGKRRKIGIGARCFDAKDLFPVVGTPQEFHMRLRDFVRFRQLPDDVGIGFAINRSGRGLDA